MKFEVKILKRGYSIWNIIPKDIFKKLGYNVGETVTININKKK